jgi:SAM-dependent methyltransferase
MPRERRAAPNEGNRRYIPALRFAALTPLYDRVVGWSTRDAALKARIAALLDPPPAARVLDLGCGSGTLLAALAGRRPDLRLIGVDADPAILAIAATRAERADFAVELRRGLAQALPLADHSVDVAVSSLLFHHLLPDAKRAALAELWRVLVPGGQLLIVDFGRATRRWRRLAFNLVRLLDGYPTTADSADGLLPGRLVEAGFADVTLRERLPVPVGSIDFLAAVAADGGRGGRGSQSTQGKPVVPANPGAK